MITRSIDQETGIVHVTAQGVWASGEVAEHYAALRALIEPIRASGQRVRILSDIREATRQAPEIEEQILAEMRRTFQAGDRVALLAADAENKATARELLRDLDVAAFQTLLPAEMWLMTDELRKIG